MPRKGRIDAPAALHHLIVRGIERRAIVRDDMDRDRFLKRLGELAVEAGTSCYAFAILPNHIHLLVRTGTVPLATFMRRLLTGYAVSFNKRHRRHGHLFQNRYKSILCEEDPYFLDLVRYIHLNPLRARIVTSIQELDTYPYSGHSCLVGNSLRDWQDRDYVLSFFSEKRKRAERLYRAFVEKGIAQGTRKDLTGGGVVRSNLGWRASARDSPRPKGDERILGRSDFVLNVLKTAGEALEQRDALRMEGYDFERVLDRVSRLSGLVQEDILSAGKERPRSQARSLLCFWAGRHLGMTATALARRLAVSQPAVTKAIARGEQIAKRDGLTLRDADDKL